MPGPSILFVVSRALALGRRAALTTVVGNTAGLAAQVTLVVAGLGAVVARSAAIFTAVKLLGAIYLVFLGIRVIVARRELATILDDAVEPQNRRRNLREGFIVGATNPKGVIIFTAVLPQFISRSAGHVSLQLALLGAICLMISLVTDSGWALVSGTARSWFGRSPRRLECVGGSSGLVMVGLGLGLAFSGRKD